MSERNSKKSKRSQEQSSGSGARLDHQDKHSSSQPPSGQPQRASSHQATASVEFVQPANRSNYAVRASQDERHSHALHGGAPASSPRIMNLQEDARQLYGSAMMGGASGAAAQHPHKGGGYQIHGAYHGSTPQDPSAQAGAQIQNANSPAFLPNLSMRDGPYLLPPRSMLSHATGPGGPPRAPTMLSPLDAHAQMQASNGLLYHAGSQPHHVISAMDLQHAALLQASMGLPNMTGGGAAGFEGALARAPGQAVRSSEEDLALRRLRNRHSAHRVRQRQKWRNQVLYYALGALIQQNEYFRRLTEGATLDARHSVAPIDMLRAAGVPARELEMLLSRSLTQLRRGVPADLDDGDQTHGDLPDPSEEQDLYDDA
ncbi:hypothetical protein FVE85_6880 [Porphyridium purpureum]|uniref:BZIP domain-containing protein n=1 Tax=Porphyridium purpureum TaxID=35688 RepID=A0A5J4Z7H8_PORPP|nr:hypothetical protein FVE85_6880 [Porphyridium purpureum]|eukprot:POR5504..scf295_1